MMTKKKYMNYYFVWFYATDNIVALLMLVWLYQWLESETYAHDLIFVFWGFYTMVLGDLAEVQDVNYEARH